MNDTFLLTGCGKGIGRSMIDSLLEVSTNRVIGIYRSDIESMDSLLNYSDRLIFLQGNAAEVGVIKKALEVCKNRFERYPNKLIVNAGTRCRYPIEEVSEKKLVELWNINYFALRNLIKILIEIKNIDNIALVYISSIVGSLGFKDLDDYGATKAASESLIRSISVRFPTSRFNVVAPGFTKSSYENNFKVNNPDLYKWTIESSLAKRWAECNEITNAALFLLSEDASYIRGQVLNVDGGWTINA